MNRQDAEKIITEYLKPIFGFALKRCKSIHDAEDLSQEIAARAFRALLVRDDIADMGKFIWTVAHNALSNYYRDAAKSMVMVGVSIDEVAELIADPCSEPDPRRQYGIPPSSPDRDCLPFRAAKKNSDRVLFRASQAGGYCPGTGYSSRHCQMALV